MSAGVIDVAVSAYARAISPMSALLFFPIHGRASRIAPDATAYPHRRGIHFGIYALWNDPAEDRQHTAWVRETWDAVQPYVPGGVYVNELGEDEGDNRVQQAYAGNYERLRTIKRKIRSGQPVLPQCEYQTVTCYVLPVLRCTCETCCVLCAACPCHVHMAQARRTWHVQALCTVHHRT